MQFTNPTGKLDYIYVERKEVISVILHNNIMSKERKKNYKQKQEQTYLNLLSLNFVQYNTYSRDFMKLYISKAIVLGMYFRFIAYLIE